MKLKTITTLAQIGSGLLFTSSFFIKDNAKAVKARWISLAIFGASWGTEIIVPMITKKPI